MFGWNKGFFIFYSKSLVLGLCLHYFHLVKVARLTFLVFMVLLVVSPQIANAQQNLIDSLRLSYNNTEDQVAKLNIAKRLFGQYVYSKVDSAIFFASEVVRFSEALNKEDELINGKKYLGIGYAVKGDYAESIKYMHENLAYHTSKDDSMNMAFSYNNIGLNHLYDGGYLDAVNNLLNAARIKEELMRDGTSAADVDLASTLMNIGIAYQSQLDTLQAKAYYIRAISEAEKVESALLGARARTSLGNLMISGKDYLPALGNFKAAEPVFVEANDLFSLGKLYNNMALVYAEMDSVSQSKIYALKGLEVNEQIGNEQSLGLAYVYLGLAELKLDRTNEAIHNSNLALQKGRELTSNSILRGAYTNLKEAYSRKGDYRKAFEFSELLDKVKEVEFAADRAEQIERLNAQYEAEKREIEIDQLSKETQVQALQLKQANTQRKLLIIGLLSALIILVLVAYFYRQIVNHRKLLEIKNTQLASLNRTKDRFFAIVSHDLRSHVVAFQNTGRLVSSFIGKKDFDKVEKTCQEIDKNATEISHLLDNLLHWSLEQLNGYKPKPENIELAITMAQMSSPFKSMAETKGISFSESIDTSHHIIVDRGGFAVIIRNLIANAIKFTAKGGVTISSVEADEYIKISIADTGIGIPQSIQSDLFQIGEDKIRTGTSNEKGTGLGLHLASEFARLNEGKLEVESVEGEGTTFCLYLKHA